MKGLSGFLLEAYWGLKEKEFTFWRFKEAAESVYKAGGYERLANHLAEFLGLAAREQKLYGARWDELAEKYNLKMK